MWNSFSTSRVVNRVLLGPLMLYKSELHAIYRHLIVLWFGLVCRE